MKLCFAVLSFAAVLTLLNIAPGPANCNKTPGCLECHSKVLEQQHKHAPVAENCAKCHKSNGREHPAPGVKGFTLIAEIPELCNKCHEAKNTKKSVHSPVATGKCLSCHEVHSSMNEALLKYPKTTFCVKCHDIEMSGKKSQHKAITDSTCEICHDAHQSEFNKLLKSNKSGLCLNCHKKEKALMGEKTVHPPFQINCLICHRGHSSIQDHLLSDSTPSLCFACHDDVEAVTKESKHRHSAVTQEKNCMNCHSPHASAEKKLLLADLTKTCLSCHNKTNSTGNKSILNIRQLVTKSTYTHGVISKTGCQGCHMPHGSPNPFILVGAYPKGGYTSENKESFLVCFTCHKMDLLLQQTTSSSTGFRDGTKNLHYLHFQGSKTRTCVNCHNVHGAMNPQLIAEKVLYGKWEMPIRFMVLYNGGSCAPGCHSEKMYKR